MNICIWSDSSFEKNYASYHLFEAFMLRLLERGHEVWLSQVQNLDGAIPQKLASYSNMHVINVKKEPVKKSNFVHRYLDIVQYFLSAGKKLKQVPKFDVIFLQSNNAAIFPVLWAKRRGIPVIFNVQDIFPLNAACSGMIRENGLIYKVFNCLQKMAYQRVDQIITISEDMANELEKIGVNKEKITTIYNWSYQDELYDHSAIDFTNIRTMIAEDKFNVVYAGNIGMMQNVELVAKIAEKLQDNKDIHFHIFGEGVRKEQIQKAVCEKGMDNISFWPIQPASEAPAIYCAADINLIPLVPGVYRTALPSKTATCLAAERPVIYAIGRESGFGKQLTKETGCPCVSAEDPSEAAEAILAIKNGTIQCHTGEFFKKSFRITENSSRYADLIEETANNRTR